VNSKGHTSSSFGVSPSKPVGKVDVVISLRSGLEIDNKVGTSSEPYKYPHSFFQNFSPSSSSSSLEIGSSSKSKDAIDGVPNIYDNPLPAKWPSDKEEPKEKDSSDSVDPSPPKDCSSPAAAKKIHKPLHPFPHKLKKKD